MERLTLDVFHHEERQSSLNNAVIGNADNVLMPYGGGRQSFLPKPRDQLRVVADEIGKNDLDRELSFQVSVASFVYDTHSALSQTAFEMIFAFENRFARDSMHRRHPVVRTGPD